MNKKVFNSFLAGLFLTSSFGCSNTQDLTSVNLNNHNIVQIQSKSRNITQITLGTYNVKNLFGSVMEPGMPTQPAKPVKELKALAESIKKINADVLAMEEVQSVRTLQGFLDTYIPNSGYNITLIPGNDERGINVCVLSRLPVIQAKTHKDELLDMPPIADLTNKFSRDLLEVRIQATDNYVFTLFVTHLKSKHGEPNASVKRKAEATKVRDILSAFERRNPDSNYTLVGDLNDTSDSAPLNPLLKSNLSLNDLINQDLGNNSSVFTFHPIQYRSRIDYMLVSPGMYNEYIKKSVLINKPETKNTKITNSFFFDASDHLPVTAKFDISSDR